MDGRGRASPAVRRRVRRRSSGRGGAVCVRNNTAGAPLFVAARRTAPSGLRCGSAAPAARSVYLSRSLSRAWRKRSDGPASGARCSRPRALRAAAGLSSAARRPACGIACAWPCSRSHSSSARARARGRAAHVAGRAATVDSVAAAVVAAAAMAGRPKRNDCGALALACGAGRAAGTRPGVPSNAQRKRRRGAGRGRGGRG